jgi:hypothetical protein
MNISPTSSEWKNKISEKPVVDKRFSRPRGTLRREYLED